ncbi:unnamed protein product, partial [Didymodactylos carnosus]
AQDNVLKYRARSVPYNIELHRSIRLKERNAPLPGFQMIEEHFDGND